MNVQERHQRGEVPSTIVATVRGDCEGHLPKGALVSADLSSAVFWVD